LCSKLKLNQGDVNDFGRKQQCIRGFAREEHIH